MAITLAIGIPVVSVHPDTALAMQAPQPVAAAGEVRVVADETGGAVLRMPKAGSLDTSSLDLDLEGGTAYGYAHIRGSQAVPFGIPCPLCPEITVETVAAWAETPSEIYVRDAKREFGQGELLEIYLVTDGPAVLTLRFSGLNGSRDLSADLPVDAHVERLPTTRCLIDCANYGMGGATRTVTSPGYAFAVAYARAPNDGPQNWVTSATVSSSAEVCAYPGLFAAEASPDPQAHPYGCDGAFDEGSRSEGLARTADFGRSVLLTADGRLSHWPNLDPDGDVYLGFMAGQRSPVSSTPGHWDAFGVWISGGLLDSVTG